MSLELLCTFENSTKCNEISFDPHSGPVYTESDPNGIESIWI